MKRGFLIALLICLTSMHVKAQYVQIPTIDVYDTGMMMAHLNAVKEMSQRAAQIRQAVHPYREQQYQYYREGKYREAIELCYNVYQQYVYYVYDNRAISDMEVLAGDCARKIGAWESAIAWYKTAQKAEVSGMDSKLSQVFDTVMEDAREAYRNNNYNCLWNDVTIALKTGRESSECYFFYGVCYERSNSLREAKKMYKRAKKYTPAIIALQNLKKKK